MDEHDEDLKLYADLTSAKGERIIIHPLYGGRARVQVFENSQTMFARGVW